jgi:hypothetical protein
VALLAPIHIFAMFLGLLTQLRGQYLFYSYVVLIELEKRHVRSVLGHRPSSRGEFYLAHIRPLSGHLIWSFN